MKDITRTELDNSLVLLTEKIPYAKKAVLLVGVNVGPINENDKLSGASHFNEHLFFKSNKHRSVRQIHEDLEFEGASFDAFTNRTSTVFHVKSLPNKLLKAIDIIYEAVTNFEYNQEEFERERRVILTEIQHCIDDPDIYSFSSIFIPTIFKGTPLEKTIDGTVKSVGSMTREELGQFKKMFYVPGNMAVVVVGNFDEMKLKKKIENTFAKMKIQKVPFQNFEASLVSKRSKKLEVHKSIQQVYLNIGFKIPGFAHADIHKLKLLDGILSAGSSSRIFRRLREEKGIGYSLGSLVNNFGDLGVFTVYIDGFEPKRFREATDVILDEFDDLKTDLVSDQELRGTKNLLISQHYDKLEKLLLRAENILNQELYRLSYDFREIPRYLKKISKEDILETARKYFTDQFTLTALVPEGFKTK